MSCIHTTRNWRRSTIPPVQLAHSNRNDSPAFCRSLFAGRSDQSVNSAVRCRLGDGRMQAGATRQHQEYEQRSNNASIQFYTTVLSSRKTLRRRHFIYRTTAASVGAAWLCVLVAATDAGCLLILPLFIRRAARLHLSIRQLPPRRDYRRSCCCCWDRFQRR